MDAVRGVVAAAAASRGRDPRRDAVPGGAGGARARGLAAQRARRLRDEPLPLARISPATRGGRARGSICWPFSRSRRPASCGSVALPGFTFVGFDVLDVHGDVSALTNCGGFDDVFTPEELNPLGLLNERGRAGAVRRGLRAAYPEEQHAVCDVWALWRWTGADREATAGTTQLRSSPGCTVNGSLGHGLAPARGPGGELDDPRAGDQPRREREAGGRLGGREAEADRPVPALDVESMLRAERLSTLTVAPPVGTVCGAVSGAGVCREQAGSSKARSRGMTAEGRIGSFLSEGSCLKPTGTTVRRLPVGESARKRYRGRPDARSRACLPCPFAHRPDRGAGRGPGPCG